ncbi:hypothetical protein ACJMK2_006647, partial [Sinanodonta woodiana]
MSEVEENGQTMKESPSKSFSIKSLLSKDKERGEEGKKEKDSPAVITKLDFPGFNTNVNFPLCFPENGGKHLAFGHFPMWYHWYMSQQCLQKMESDHPKK